jgi:transcription initiation factor TFIID subunit 6
VTDTNPTGLPNAEKLAANHIRNLILKSVCPVLKNIRSPPDVVEEYKNDYGAIGKKNASSLPIFNLNL